VKWQQNNASVVEVDTYDYDNMNDKCNFCPSSQVLSFMPLPIQVHFSH